MVFSDDEQVGVDVVDDAMTPELRGRLDEVVNGIIQEALKYQDPNLKNQMLINERIKVLGELARQEALKILRHPQIATSQKSEYLNAMQSGILASYKKSPEAITEADCTEVANSLNSAGPNLEQQIRTIVEKDSYGTDQQVHKSMGTVARMLGDVSSPSSAYGGMPIGNHIGYIAHSEGESGIDFARSIIRPHVEDLRALPDLPASMQRYYDETMKNSAAMEWNEDEGQYVEIVKK